MSESMFIFSEQERHPLNVSLKKSQGEDSNKLKEMCHFYNNYNTTPIKKWNKCVFMPYMTEKWKTRVLKPNLTFFLCKSSWGLEQQLHKMMRPRLSGSLNHYRGPRSLRWLTQFWGLGWEEHPESQELWEAELERKGRSRELGKMNFSKDLREVREAA